MAEPAFIAFSGAPADARHADGAAGARRSGTAARLYCRVEAPPIPRRAEPPAGEDATDHTAFSMVGVAG